MGTTQQCPACTRRALAGAQRRKQTSVAKPSRTAAPTTAQRGTALPIIPTGPDAVSSNGPAWRHCTRFRSHHLVWFCHSSTRSADGFVLSAGGSRTAGKAAATSRGRMGATRRPSKPSPRHCRSMASSQGRTSCDRSGEKRQSAEGLGDLAAAEEAREVARRPATPGSRWAGSAGLATTASFRRGRRRTKRKTNSGVDRVGGAAVQTGRRRRTESLSTRVSKTLSRE